MVLNNAPSSIDSKLAEEREKRAKHFKNLLTNNLQLTDWQMGFTSLGLVTQTSVTEPACVRWEDEDAPICPRMICAEYGSETRTVQQTILNPTNSLYTLRDSSNQPLQATSNMDAFKYTLGLDDPGDVKILAPSLTSAYDSTLDDILEKTTTSNQFGHAGFEMAGLEQLINSDHPYKQKLRPDAFLAIIFITDRDDRTNVYPQDVIKAIESNLGSSKQFATYGITTKPNDSTCIRKYGMTENNYWGVQASKVEYFTFLTEGQTVSVCDSNHKSAMSKLSKAIMARPDLTKPIELKHKNILEDTIQLHPDTFTWTYNSNTNTISLDNPPLGNTKVQISYSYHE